MRLLPYKTSFGRFFNRTGPVPIPNSISLIIDEHTVECNGPILAQHSSVLFEKLTTGKDIYLDEFSGMVEGVMDCIELLYGEEVEVSMGNLQAIMKFSVLFKVEEMYGLCVKWVRENASVDGFEEFYKVSQFIYSLDKTRGDCLEVCRDIMVLNCDGPENLRDNLISKFSSNEDENSDLMMFFLEEGLLGHSIHVITEWLDTSNKVGKVLERIEQRKLHAALSDQTLKAEGINFIKKLKEISSSNQIADLSELQIKLMELNYSKCQKGDSLVQQNLEQKQLQFFLLEKTWNRYSGPERIDKVSSMSFNHAIYVELCLAAVSVSPMFIVSAQCSYQLEDDSPKAKAKAKANIDALWPTINPMLVGKYFCHAIEKKARLVLPEYPFIDLPETAPDGYFTQLTKSQLGELNSSKQVTILNVCQVQGCTDKTKHAVTVKLTDSYPCYDLDVEQVMPPDVRCHTHPNSICHWYLCRDVVTSSSLEHFGTVSLAASTYQDINYFLNQDTKTGGSGRNRWTIDYTLFIGCIVSITADDKGEGSESRK